MEFFPSIKKNNLEKLANFEGNCTEIFFRRLDNSEIKKQLVNLFLEFQKHRNNYFQKTTFKFDEKIGFYEDQNGALISKEDKDNFKSLTKKEIIDIVERRIKEQKFKTNIEFSGSDKIPDSESINLDFVFRGKKFNPKQLSYTESHEKGHKIRTFNDSFFRKYFSSGFDFSKITISDEDIMSFDKMFGSEFVENNADIEKRKEHYKKGLIKYLSSGSEIAERMSQLKNYFGFSGSEIFKKEHLEYTRKNFVNDVMDNGMRNFFEAITPETEENFLFLINNSGI